MLLYAITSRILLPGTDPERQSALIELARSWSQGGIDYIQIREKDLAAHDLLALSRGIVNAVRAESPGTRILINGPAEIALAAGADGVHLPSSAPADGAEEARQTFQSARRNVIISRACHSLQEIAAAPDEVSMLVFAPVFEKASQDEARPGVGPGIGLDALAAACRATAPTPIMALGGITTQNATDCLTAGAAGVAGIRLFLDNDWRKLRRAH